MQKLASFIIKFRYALIVLFIAAAAVSVWASSYINVNYDITKYLPDDSATAHAFETMEDQFGNIGYAQMMVRDVTAEEANDIYAEIRAVNGIDSVMFDSSDTESYRDGNALYRIYLTHNDFTEEATGTLDTLRTMLSDRETAFSGFTAESGFTRDAIEYDCRVILALAVVVVLLILLLTSCSWADPLVFAIGVGVALLINNGTNAIFDEISFVSQSICMILQIALAMDYSIIILHRYNEERTRTLNRYEAMKAAVSGSLLSILSASLTTVAGLVAIMCMKFTIGFDIGIVLAKGIVVSLMMSFFFLPCVILLFDRLIEKTKHKRLLPDTKKLMSFAYRSRRVIPAVALLVFIVGAVIQTGLSFSYSIDIPEDTAVYAERQAIYDEFGNQNPIIVLVPLGNAENEKLLTERISEITVDGKKAITSATGVASAGLYDMLSADDAAQKFGISASLVSEVFAALSDEGRLTQDGKISASGLLAYISDNDYISAYADTLQQKLDTAAGFISLIGGSVTAEQIAAAVGVSREEACALMYDANSGLFDGKTLSGADFILCASGMDSAASFTIGGKSIGDYAALVAEARKAYTSSEITADARFGAIFDNASIAAAFAAYSADAEKDTLEAWQLLEYASVNKLVTARLGAGFASLQEQIDGLYEESKLLFAELTVASAAEYASIPEKYVFAVFCAAYPDASAGISADIDSLTLTADDAAALLGIAADSLKELFAEGAVPVKTLITRLSTEKSVSALGDAMQEQADSLRDTADYAMKKLVGTEYTRMVFNMNFPTVSPEADSVVEQLRASIPELYPDYCLLGSSVNNYDVRETFGNDITTVNTISVLSVFIIVMLSFGSAVIPAVLVAAIQGSIFANLAIDALTGTPVFFVCYIIAICIQMGATIDYAILLTNRYTEYRRTMGVKEAMTCAMNASITTILTSGLILIIAAGLVGYIATVPLISSIGMLISKGALISVITVLFVLPQTLCLFDRLIEKLTRGAHFSGKSGK